MAVPAYTTVRVDVQGPLGGNQVVPRLSSVNSLLQIVKDNINRQFGQVITADVKETGWFTRGYVADFVYVTRRQHADKEDIRNTIAGEFQKVFGGRPSVRIVSPANISDGAAAAVVTPTSSGDGDDWAWLRDIKWIAVAAAVVAVVIVAAPTVRTLQK